MNCPDDCRNQDIKCPQCVDGSHFEMLPTKIKEDLQILFDKFDKEGYDREQVMDAIVAYFDR